MSPVLYSPTSGSSQTWLLSLCRLLFWVRRGPWGLPAALVTHRWIGTDKTERRTLMFCLEVLSRYRLSLHRGTTLGEKLRASRGISVLVSIPSFYLKYRLCTNGRCVRLTGWIPASFFNVCMGFSVDIMLCHFKFPGLAQERAVFHQIRSRQT